VRIVLILEYDGSQYCGWQSQPNGCSVQDALERALLEIACETIRVVTAGRTDTGVHALYQVVHFDTLVCRPLSAWVRGVNAFLPKDIAVLWASEISVEFHARFSAIERHYQYLLSNHSVRPAINHQKTGWYHAALNLESMQMAARILIGKHDFSAFRASECQAKSPIRTLTRLEISQQGNLFFFDIRANAFLQHMVRNIVGCLVYVGKGKYSPDWIQSLLESRNRTDAAPTFSADGLYLAGVKYDSEWQLPELTQTQMIVSLTRP
jgi:tRNA pseudouridine38-40 synthase